MLLAEMSPGDWLAIATAVGAGISGAGVALGTAIRFGFNKYAEIRREERKHEVTIAQRFTESAERIQREAAEDNRKALENGQRAFATLIEIQGKSMEGYAALSGAIQQLETSVCELRNELGGHGRPPQPGPRRRPVVSKRPVENQQGADDQP